MFERWPASCSECRWVVDAPLVSGDVVFCRAYWVEAEADIVDSAARASRVVMSCKSLYLATAVSRLRVEQEGEEAV